MSRDEPDKANGSTVKVSMPDGVTTQILLRESTSVEEFLANACNRKNLNPVEHFVRVKKRRDMEDHNYFVPHRSDLIETYVSMRKTKETIAMVALDGYKNKSIDCSYIPMK